MHYPLLFFIVAAFAFYVFNDVDNPIHRYASRMVKVEDKTLKQMDETAAAYKGTAATSRCAMDMSFDYACASVTTAGNSQQYPVYFWGPPGAQSPRTESAAACKKACETKGRGLCAWRENGPEFNGGTSCYFISEEICSHSSIVATAASAYLPSQVKSILSGRCE